MAGPIEFNKFGYGSDIKAQALESVDLPFASVPASANAAIAAAGERAGDFQSYLNGSSVLRLTRHRKRGFDAVAEILNRSVYKPIENKQSKQGK